MIKLKDLLFERSANDSDDTGGVLYSCFNEFLLCLTAQSRQWNVPKGHIMIDEAPSKGSLREFTEETQIILNGNPKLLETFNKSNGGKMHMYALEGEKRFVPRLDHEHVDWGYFSKDKLPSPLNEFVEIAIGKYYD